MISKIKRVVLASSFALFAFSYISCNNEIKNNEEYTKNQKTGSATLSIFVPNYNKIEEYETKGARVIAPQTNAIKFSYKYEENGETENISLDSMLLSQANSEAVENADEEVFGSIYTVTFSGIYVGTYAAGDMTVELLDSAGETISKGTNESEVVVSKENAAKAKFYTLPVSYDDESSSLSFGQMKFFKISLDENKVYKLTISVEEGQTAPSIVVFNENGTYNSYKKDSSITFEKSEEERIFYIGVYAKESACTYKSELVYLAEDIELDSTEIELDFDGTYQISYSVNPSGAAVSSVTYTSSNDKISVSENGLIKASSESDGLQEATITVNVDGIEKSISVKVQKAVSNISLNDSLFLTTTNGTVTVKATVLPADATDPSVTWTIDDESVGTISDGVITGVKEGITTLIAKAGNKSTVATLVVLKAENSFSVTSSDDLKKLTSDDSSDYEGYITDAAGKIAYKYTTDAHAAATGLSSGIGKWDIIGKKGDTWYSSTYKNAGWGWKINDSVVSLSNNGIATKDNLRLQVKPYLVYNKGVPFIMLLQLLTNTSSRDLTGQKFGSGTDVQIAGNDQAPVNASDFGANLIDSTTNMIFSLNCLEGDAITPVNTMWIGNYSSGAMANVYTDNRVSCVDIDSAISYSWQDIDIAAGETKVFAVRLTFVEDEGGSLNGIIY